jgi:hypothetical protein
VACPRLRGQVRHLSRGHCEAQGDGGDLPLRMPMAQAERQVEVKERCAKFGQTDQVQVPYEVPRTLAASSGAGQYRARVKVQLRCRARKRELDAGDGEARDGASRGTLWSVCRAPYNITIVQIQKLLMLRTKSCPGT